MTYQPAPPPTEEGDEILHDAPGRCGGIDAHSHHFRVVKAQYGGFYLLVQHGGGTERISLGHRSFLIGVLWDLDEGARYWLLHDIYNVQRNQAQTARDSEAGVWRQAAAEKRIKTRKHRNAGRVKVWIAPTTTAPQPLPCSYA